MANADLGRHLSGILAVLADQPSSNPCQCACGVRHRQRMSICAGHLDGGAVRVWFDDGSDVRICLPCADAYPDIDVVPTLS